MKSEFKGMDGESKRKGRGANGDAAAKRKKKKQKNKNKNKPKRARSAYTFFVAENRSKIQKANPQFSFFEIGKALGAAWKACDNKDHYSKLAEADKKRAARERELWEKTRPKRAISAYAYFVQVRH